MIARTNRINIAFCDGHAEGLMPGDFNRVSVSPYQPAIKWLSFGSGHFGNLINQAKHCCPPSHLSASGIGNYICNSLMEHSPFRILFIGNSFTNRNDLPGMITRLAASAKRPKQIETERIIANGTALKSHWEKGKAREAINGSAWDFVVLQEQSTLPLKNRARMQEYITLFNQEIKSAGAKTVLYLTWARRNATDRQDELSDAYLSIGHQLGCIIAPVGIAWQKVITEHSEVVLHAADKSHPNPLGTYLAACVFYARLLNRSPVGLQADPELKKVEPKTLQMLQQTAMLVCANP